LSTSQAEIVVLTNEKESLETQLADSIDINIDLSNQLTSVTTQLETSLEININLTNQINILIQTEITLTGQLDDCMTEKSSLES
jgi:sensor domain CHASE-containing protein